jgi:diphthine-ammonia ligase
MIEYPLTAIVIKIASYGLQVQHLGRTIAELYSYFMKMKEECGMNVCGEGGEYESVVLDCPLFKKTIVMYISSYVK